MNKNETKSISVPNVSAADCKVLSDNGVTLTTLIRKTIKEEAAKCRVIERNKQRALKKLEQ